MKKLLTILLTVLNLNANDLFLYDKNNDVELTEVINQNINFKYSKDRLEICSFTSFEF